MTYGGNVEENEKVVIKGSKRLVFVPRKNTLPVFYCYNLSLLALPTWSHTIQSPVK